MVLIEKVLGEKRLGLPMCGISSGRPNESGDIMAMLKIHTVDSNDGG